MDDSSRGIEASQDHDDKDKRAERREKREERREKREERREKREERKLPPARITAFLRCPVATSKKL